MRKTFAIHCPNNTDILFRIHNDLVLKGFEEDDREHDYLAMIKSRCSAIEVYADKVLRFRLRIYSEFPREHRELTEENYNAILQEILENQ